MASCQAANETAAKVYYFLVFGLTVLITWVLRDYAQDGLRHVPEIKTCFNNQVSSPSRRRPCSPSHPISKTFSRSCMILNKTLTCKDLNALPCGLYLSESSFLMQADGSPGECTGKGAVLRVSFGNFIFFAGHFLFLLGCRKQKDARKYLHTGCLTLQTLVWAGIIGSTFAMPNHVFFVWGQVC